MSAIVQLKAQLSEAENILNTDFSFDLAEPVYRRCLAILLRKDVVRTDATDLMCSMFNSNTLSDEPISYLMHVLRWPEIRVWAETTLRNMEHPLLDGAPLERILNAYDDLWPHREFYAFS